MRVAYDSDAVFDEKVQAVKFAGMIVEGRAAGRFIICRIPKETLVKSFNLYDPEPEMLLQCYAAAKQEITSLATQKAVLGNYRPIIDEIAQRLSAPDCP